MTARPTPAKRPHRIATPRNGIAHARQIAQDARLRLQERAGAYEATLRSEGYSEIQARSRALQAYGLADTPQRQGDLRIHLADYDSVPELPLEWRRAARDHYASQRGTVLGERSAAERKNDIAVAARNAATGWTANKGRKRGSTGPKPKAVNGRFWLGFGGEL